MDQELQERIAQVASLAQAICQAMQQEAFKLGFTEQVVQIGDPTQATYYLSKDPASGEQSLLGEWRDQQGYKQGELTFHADGSFYAEYDIVQVHPQNARLFVEAINAWGRDQTIKAEPKLMPMVSDDS